MGVLLKILEVVVLVVIAEQALRTVILLGVFENNYQHYPGPCQIVEGVQPGSEDFHILPNGHALISSGLRYEISGPKCQEFWKKHGVKGRVYLMDLKNVQAAPTELKITSTSQFNADTFAPHGISVWEDREQGRHVVFVVNHPYEYKAVKSRVEKFIYDPAKQELIHQTYFSDPAMMGVNDLQATGENSFYFTNSNHFTKPLVVLLELLLEMPLNNLVYYDGQTYTVFDSDLKNPHGVAMSPDGKYVYVAYFVSRRLAVFKRYEDNALRRLQIYPFHGWPDKIQVDQKTGHLFVALHPIAYKFLLHSDDIGEQTSPSQVIQLEVEDGLIKSFQVLFYDHGDLISGSSTAIVYDGTLLVGSVFHNLVTCKVNVPHL